MDPWIIIPAYNEESRVADVVKKAQAHSSKIVVVDDGSADRTADNAYGAGATVLTHVINLGKGAALKTGCDYAQNNGAEIMVVLDADGQHDPNDIPRFIREIEKGSEVVFGYREGKERMPMVLRFGNHAINLATKILYRISLRDTQSGFRAFTSDAYSRIRWKATDYSMESEMIANLGKRRMRYSEIPIPVVYHDAYKGTTIVDGIKIVFNMMLWRLTR